LTSMTAWDQQRLRPRADRGVSEAVSVPVIAPGRVAEHLAQALAAGAEPLCASISITGIHDPERRLIWRPPGSRWRGQSTNPRSDRREWADVGSPLRIVLERCWSTPAVRRCSPWLGSGAM